MRIPRPAPLGRAVSVAPVPLGERAAGPDLARGAALLGIALANTIGWLYGEDLTALSKQEDAGFLDRTVDVLVGLLADNRGFPLFALLLGYGIGVLWRRSRERGEGIGRFRLRMLRRSLVLLVIGIAHGLLLFSGDIVAAYAVIGMFAVLLVDRWRMILVAMILLASTTMGLWGWLDGLVGLGGGLGHVDLTAMSYRDGLLLRADGYLGSLVRIPIWDLALLAPMLIGVLASRVQLLEDVSGHRELLGMLWRWMLPISLLGALPLVAVIVVDPGHEVLTSSTVLGVLGIIHQLTGLAGAVAYAAIAALLADRAARIRAERGRSTPAVAAASALVALGRMSLTAYLLHSVVALLLFPAYTLGLGGSVGSAGAAALMTAAWAVGLVLAIVLDRLGRRGPLEVILRRISAGRTP